MLAELHHLLRGSLQVLAQPTLLLAQLRRTVPDSRRRAREARLTEQFSTDPLPGLGRQQLHMDRSWHGLVPDQATPSRRLLLLHVPKTGGTSLRLMLQDHVPVERRFLSTGDYQWADTSIRGLSQYELFVGHNFLEPLYLLPGEDWVTALLVREPLAWWRSRYTYRRAMAMRAGDRHHPLLWQSMGQWIDGSTDAVLSNGQSSWLLARVRLMFDAVGAGTIGSASRVGRDAISGTGRDLSRDPQAALDLLDRLLDHVTVLGVTHDLHAVYVASCRAMGWVPSHTKEVRDNVSVHDPDLVALTPLQEQRLRSLNVIDQHLYDRASAAAADLRRRHPLRGERSRVALDRAS